MAIKNPPPQAYTRDVLSKAYEWLKTQPNSVKNRAEGVDQLVSLYLHAKRYGELNSEVEPNDTHPISSQSFKSELKELAQDIRQFDEPQVSIPTAPETPPASAPVNLPEEVELKPMTPMTRMTQNSVKPTAKTTLPNETPSVNGAPFLDSRSRAMTQKVKDRFNLSSDEEALRMLIVLGYESLQKAFD